MHLKSLLEATNDAIEAVREECKNEAVNWERAMCIQAEVYATDTGHYGRRVWIDEASENAIAFRHAVAQHLEGNGFPDIEVMTEW